jgi:hypothetical protein
MPTLYQIEEDMQAFMDLMFEVGGDVSDEEADAAITAWMEENEENLAQKLDGYGAVIRELEADASACQAEVERLAARATARRNAVARLKERLRDFLQRHDTKKVQTPRFTFARQANGGKQPMQVLVEPHLLPAWAQVERIDADNEAIREKLERGETLSFAQLLPRGEHLRVR